MDGINPRTSDSTIQKRQNTAALQNVAVTPNANSLAFWSAAVPPLLDVLGLLRQAARALRQHQTGFWKRYGGQLAFKQKDHPHRHTDIT